MVLEHRGGTRLDNGLGKRTLFDLIHERNVQFRRQFEKVWTDFDMPISYSEWSIMDKIRGKQPTISEVSKQAYITRQATHKFVKSLEAKGLVEVLTSANGRKTKTLRLTPQGERYYELNETIKQQYERQVAEQIGQDRLDQLKELLGLDWGIGGN